MKISAAGVLFAFLASIYPALADNNAAKKDLARMQGVRQLASGESDGEAAGAYALEHFRCEFKEDLLTFEGIAPLTDKAGKLRVRIVDTTTIPKCIDLKIEAGDMKGVLWEGAYDWQGDNLKLCQFIDKGNRPGEFEAKRGSNRIVLVLKKVKP
ncbi:MAG TPA: TIGR03067 domain-containing protein [Gemmataceae bacterium]|nr:TIGR03067 domain-containing protein [Gemmataceae bacterium]